MVEDSSDTIPAPESDPEPEPIAAGKARLAVTLAFVSVAKAVTQLEGAILALHATSDGIARALDATTSNTKGAGQ
jgi:hypothetical protein